MAKIGKTGGTSKGGFVATRTIGAGFKSKPAAVIGRVQASGSFGLPNGDRIGTVRRDIMDHALGRQPEKKN